MDQTDIRHPVRGGEVLALTSSPNIQAQQCKANFPSDASMQVTAGSCICRKFQPCSQPEERREVCCIWRAHMSALNWAAHLQWSALYMAYAP